MTKLMMFRTVTSSLGNLGGDAAFAGCNDDEVVLGGGGTCSAAPTLPNGYGTTITSMPVSKGSLFSGNVPAWGNAPLNGWVYDCNGYPGVGGIAQAVVACGKP